MDIYVLTHPLHFKLFYLKKDASDLQLGGAPPAVAAAVGAVAGVSSRRVSVLPPPSSGPLPPILFPNTAAWAEHAVAHQQTINHKVNSLNDGGLLLGR